MTQIPLFQPPSEWLPPERIPELREAKEIAIDLETNDPDLKHTGQVGQPVMVLLLVWRLQWKDGKDIFLCVTKVAEILMRSSSRLH